MASHDAQGSSRRLQPRPGGPQLRGNAKTRWAVGKITYIIVVVALGVGDAGCEQERARRQQHTHGGHRWLRLEPTPLEGNTRRNGQE
jgi:hypothetical protein